MPRFHLFNVFIHTATKRFAGARDGATAVEFAMVAPIFILILIGILVYGIYFGTALSVTQIAAEAARASVGGLSNAERTTLAENKAEAMIRSYGFLSAERMTVIAAAQADDADVFDVAVTYDASNLPIYAFDGLLPVPPSVITRRSSIQRGGF